MLGLFGAEPSALGAAEDTVGRGSMYRGADSETHDDEDEELPPPLDIPLFAVEKVLAVRPRSKDADGEVQRSSFTSSPNAGSSARASGDPASGAFASEDDASDTRAAGRAEELAKKREGRREFVAAACTSEAAARPGDPPATRVFHAAAHTSEEGTRHHLELRAERAASEGGAESGGALFRALPWYEGEQARVTSLEFSPGPAGCSDDAGDGPLLLCGTRGGGVYVIPAGAALAETETEREPGAAARGPAARVLCTAGAPIVSALWWRKRASSTSSSLADDDDARRNKPPGEPASFTTHRKSGDSSLVAVACAATGEIRFWSARGAPLCAVFAGGRAFGAAVVDAGADLGQFLLISGERASVMAARGARVSGTSRALDAHHHPVDEGEPKAHWTLVLERGDDALPAAAGRRGFSPALVEGRFGAPAASEAGAFASRAALSVHVGAHDGAHPGGTKPAAQKNPLGSTIVARLSAAAETVTLFHPANDVDAFATYRVPPGTIAVRVTRRLIFALHRGRRGGRARLSVLVREDEAASLGFRPDGGGTGDAEGAAADPEPRSRGDGNPRLANAPAASTDGADPGAGAGAGAGASTDRPVWRYREIVPVVLQELTLSSGVGRPLARALMPCGDRRGENGAEAFAAFEGCAVAAQGATLACRPTTPSPETVVRGLLGTAKGTEADAFARAARRAAGKDAARRRGEADAGRGRSSGASAAPRAGGDSDAETLLRMLRVPRARRAALYAEAVEHAARVGDVARAARLASKAAPRAATALCVAACLGEWRAADALDHLDRLASPPLPATRFFGDAEQATTRRADETASRGTRSRTERERERDRDRSEDDEGAWLRLCCAAHLELSAWAASAAAAAIGAAGEIAEASPDVSASFPWPSGALSPPLAADAADALARAAAAAAPAHQESPHQKRKSPLGSLRAAARAARRAADAAAGIAAFVRASARASARGDDAAARAARRGATSTLRVTLAAGSAADTFHRGGEALRRFVAYAPNTGGEGLGGSLGEEEEEDGGSARSPAAAARAVAAAALSPGGSPGGARSDSSGIVAVLPLMRAEDRAELAAEASEASDAAEIRVAALLSLAARRDESPGGDEAQRRLERALREGLRARTVRPQWAIAATTGFENASAAAIALASAGNWLAATRNRLRAVEDAFPTDDALSDAPEASEASAEAALVATLAEYASRAETTAARASALAAVARAWRARRLSREALESLLLADADAVGVEALAEMLRGGAGKTASLRCGAGKGDAADASSADEDSDVFQFSASFALRVASLRARAAAGDAGDDEDENEGGSRNRKETEATRWRRARRALCADEAAAAAVYFSARAAREMRGDEDGVAFTCGHVVSDAALRASAAALADAWRDEGCPMSGDLVAAEYAKRRVALACPVCVGAAAREDAERQHAVV